MIGLKTLLVGGTLALLVLMGLAAPAQSQQVHMVNTSIACTLDAIMKIAEAFKES